MSDQTTPTEPTVSQMMRTDVPTIPPTMEIGDLARLLSDERMSSVAVVDDGKLVGMVGQSDLIFQEIDLNKVERPKGMNITFVTTAENDEQALHLLRGLGVPFARN